MQIFDIYNMQFFSLLLIFSELYGNQFDLNTIDIAKICTAYSKHIHVSKHCMHIHEKKSQNFKNN